MSHCNNFFIYGARAQIPLKLRRRKSERIFYYLKPNWSHHMGPPGKLFFHFPSLYRRSLPPPARAHIYCMRGRGGGRFGLRVRRGLPIFREDNLWGHLEWISDLFAFAFSRLCFRSSPVATHKSRREGSLRSESGAKEHANAKLRFEANLLRSTWLRRSCMTNCADSAISPKKQRRTEGERKSPEPQWNWSAALAFSVWSRFFSPLQAEAEEC